MAITVSAVNARRTLGELLNRVLIADDEIVIERAGKKVARLVSCKPQALGKRGGGKRDFGKTGGLGAELWKEVNVHKYVKREREQ